MLSDGYESWHHPLLYLNMNDILFDQAASLIGEYFVYCIGIAL